LLKLVELNQPEECGSKG